VGLAGGAGGCYTGDWSRGDLVETIAFKLKSHSKGMDDENSRDN
jgi:hypothetical protein